VFLIFRFTDIINPVPRKTFGRVLSRDMASRFHSVNIYEDRLFINPNDCFDSGACIDPLSINAIFRDMSLLQNKGGKRTQIFKGGFSPKHRKESDILDIS
jgi:hypothetical protein